MKITRGNFVYTAAIFLLLVFTPGCTQVQQSSKGLQICSMTSAIGAVEEDTIDQQRISYAINIRNDSDQQTYISFVEPLLAAGINGRLLSGDTRVEVKKKVAAHGSLDIKGEFIFDSKNLSKQDIIAMEPIITGYRIGTEQQIELPGNGVRK
ncbi:hypothetical protein ASZ90_019743 [hydrocarbon metagenome]|uniref:Uncharacterized protein n=1 Tax=hydrocarbon metagenome TaxID=938273 RepID=A0A0W8E356_9ZZZZ